ncbi:MAG: cation:proton antiporter [Acidobacteriota bacterium]|jgi:CPA2 family monovalent cation:H+ antiporter-2|nr:cation:proton antiporter [Acidobacteriaceae bacterium]
MGIAADFVLIVVAGLLGALLARALKLPLLVGYVAAGVVVGPHTGGPTVGQVREIELLAEIGAALLLFSLGLEVSLRDLQPVRRVALLGGALQVVLTIVAGATAGTGLFGMGAGESVWFGAMVALSSTMVVVKTLAAGGVTSTLASRVMIGILVVQDLSVIPMLIVLPQLQTPGAMLPKLAQSIALAAVSLALVVLLGTRLLPRLLRRILAWGSQELFLVAVVATGVGVGYAAHAVGFSFALGAFVAGIILSESEFSHQALSDLAPLRDIFGLIFFVTVGMLFDPAYVLQNPGSIALAVTLILLGKAIILGGITRLFGYVNMAPWIVGMGLAQIGEFSFVIARSGISSGSISKSTYDLALTCTVLTMAVSPLFASAAIPLGRWARRRRKPAALPVAVAPPQSFLEDHIIVAGYGRSGRAAARVLRAAGVPVLIVEFNYLLYRDLVADGFHGLWGDITTGEILHAANAARARVLLLTIPDHGTIYLALERAHRLHPSLAVVVRATREEHLVELRRHGVDTAVLPEFEGGVEMVRQALLRYPQDGEAMRAAIKLLRDEYYGPAALSA